jgi:hypothetical protein
VGGHRHLGLKIDCRLFLVLDLTISDPDPRGIRGSPVTDTQPFDVFRERVAAAVWWCESRYCRGGRFHVTQNVRNSSYRETTLRIEETSLSLRGPSCIASTRSGANALSAHHLHISTTRIVVSSIGALVRLDLALRVAPATCGSCRAHGGSYGEHYTTRLTRQLEFRACKCGI